MSQIKDSHILLSHGSGGKLAQELIHTVFVRRFGKAEQFLTDSAELEVGGQTLAFTTDSYVVDPIFFPGGNIGKLAVCGTVNDLAVSGAKPLYLTSAFIIEEGFSLNELEIIAETMAQEAARAGVKIVAGDTKVVPKGKCDKVFINTAGVGLLPQNHRHIGSGKYCKAGDKIIINGPVAAHGVAVMAVRNHINFEPQVVSDCAALNHLIAKALVVPEHIKFMRDATRGGLATVLCELASGIGMGVDVSENNIPVSSAVAGFCEVFGYDPLYVANEGLVVMVVDGTQAGNLVDIMRSDTEGSESCIIGEITANHAGQVVMQTAAGGRRILDLLTGEQLPRIC